MTPLPSSTSSETARAIGDEPILAREAELREAMLANDVAALDRLIDDALVFTGPDGSVATKADDLDARRTGRVRMTKAEPGERRIVHLAPGVVLVVVRVELAGTFDGAPFHGPYRYTRIWAERPDGWRIVGGHVSAIVARPRVDGTRSLGADLQNPTSARTDAHL